MKPRQNRRTTNDINKAIIEATSESIIQVGFMRVNLKEVSDRGNISAQVIYNHFGSIDELLDGYVEKFDYWINHTIETNPLKVNNPQEYYTITLEKVIRSFSKNRELQQLMIWEMAEDNPTTRKTSQKREVSTEKLIEYFQGTFSESGIDISPFIAIVIGGIYHAILKKDRSTLCGVDFSTKEGLNRLINAATAIISLLHEKVRYQKRIKETILCLHRNNVSVGVISEATELSSEEVIQVINAAGPL